MSDMLLGHGISVLTYEIDLENDVFKIRSKMKYQKDITGQF